MPSLKTYLITTFWKQNSYHQHGVLVHTLRVVLETIKAGRWKMLPAALLHDIGKPRSAHQKPEDVKNGEYSFTDHEEISYEIIKTWPFISDYTKLLVRHHYLIRRMTKARQKGKMEEYARLRKTYLAIPKPFRREIAEFMRIDDLGKGRAKNGHQTAKKPK